MFSLDSVYNHFDFISELLYYRFSLEASWFHQFLIFIEYIQ